MENQKIKKLNVGCGEAKKEGFVNIDWNELAKPDVIHDLNVIPYPLEESSFDLIEASHILEHLDRPFDVMREFQRILKPGGMLYVKVPHFSRGFTHAEHSHGFDVTFPLYFNKNFIGGGFFGVEFELKKLELHWSAFTHLFPSMGYGRFMVFVFNLLNKIISFFANLSPAFASRIWCYWVGGFEEIEFHFQNIK